MSTNVNFGRPQQIVSLDSNRSCKTQEVSGVEVTRNVKNGRANYFKFSRERESNDGTRAKAVREETTKKN